MKKKTKHIITDEQLRIEILEGAIKKIKNMTTKGLRAQILRGDRTQQDMFMIALRATDRIEIECLEALS